MRPLGISTLTGLWFVLSVGDFFVPHFPGTAVPTWIFVAIASFEVGLFWLLLWFFWRGHNWSRIVMLLVSPFSIVSLGAVSFPLISALMWNATVISAAALSLFQLYYLNKSMVRAWFKKGAEARKTSRMTIALVSILAVLVSIYGLEAMHVKYLRHKLGPEYQQLRAT
ncbi:hypothetical protein Acid345_0102 [Candidatus Koribacter versatilis Ellin345]|uniref:Uncharacterized protein n=1 Tax=Koribacter versatilis (strain Ellin345) TaxID=204669 RepID=Q1IVJ3_KORVE|nr:hypothetical protein [Candidatus Koribacter versatilis]ABF39107.1 hypothetical protein Acid345_0102 [Candidatus Koribacter versatilis Ellin345]